MKKYKGVRSKKDKESEKQKAETFQKNNKTKRGYNGMSKVKTKGEVKEEQTKPRQAYLGEKQALFHIGRQH